MPHPTFSTPYPGQKISPDRVDRRANCWIDLDGKVYHVEPYGHCDAAIEMGDVTGGVAFGQAGYVHVTGGTIAGSWEEFTQAQIDSLFEVVANLQMRYPDSPAVRYMQRQWDRFMKESVFFR